MPLSTEEMIEAPEGLGHLVVAIADSKFGRYMLLYITEQVSLPPQRIEATLECTGTDPDEVEALMGTAAQVWFDQGEARGKSAVIAKGKTTGLAEGKSETLTRQLDRRFGRLPDEIRVHIADAGLKQLDRWLDAVLDAPTVDAVFRSNPEH